ncbi:MAG: hypothetical protein ABUT39_14070 [Acidobacteriota bacterium]
MISANPILSSRLRAVPVLACAVLALTASLPLQAEDPNAAALVAQLRVPDWWTVHCTELELESLQAKAVPALLDLLDSREVVPLENTMDLIYPGAKTFYGHGYMVDYAIDSLAVRAGWTLESLTFQDFGFRSGTIQEDALFRAMRENPPGDMPLEQALGPQKAPGPVAEAAARARKWWAKAGPKWTRFQGIVEALDSNDPDRQFAVLGWLRDGDRSECDGLKERYEKEIKPRVAKLAGSKDENVRQQAGYLLESGLPTPFPEIEGVFGGLTCKKKTE